MQLQTQFLIFKFNKYVCKTKVLQLLYGTWVLCIQQLLSKKIQFIYYFVNYWLKNWIANVKVGQEIKLSCHTSCASSIGPSAKKPMSANMQEILYLTTTMHTQISIYSR